MLVPGNRLSAAAAVVAISFVGVAAGQSAAPKPSKGEPPAAEAKAENRAQPGKPGSEGKAAPNARAGVPGKPDAPGKPSTAGKPADPGKPGSGRPDMPGKPMGGMGEGKGMHGMPEGTPAAERRAAAGEFRTAMRALHADLRAGTIKKEELKERLEALRESRKERQREHREAMKARWGDALARPPALQELRHHARRLAWLNRALILAETERKGADKNKLVERIEKLIEKENERHARAMERFEEGKAKGEDQVGKAKGLEQGGKP